ATLSQRANNAIVATQTASTFFIMPAIFAGHVAQLKMPRLDAYLAHAALRLGRLELPDFFGILRPWR
ncbi:hypothetical protein, partial [Acidovorax sp. SD340]|uniref:hypothetical protein n=1 Tax=Acidovorax sp. SD340 TaxID=1690268 RepID=UPI0006E4B8E4